MAGSPRQAFSEVMGRIMGGNPQDLNRIGGLCLVAGPGVPSFSSMRTELTRRLIIPPPPLSSVLPETSRARRSMVFSSSRGERGILRADLSGSRSLASEPRWKLYYRAIEWHSDYQSYECRPVGIRLQSARDCGSGKRDESRFDHVTSGFRPAASSRTGSLERQSVERPLDASLTGRLWIYSARHPQLCDHRILRRACKRGVLQMYTE